MTPPPRQRRLPGARLLEFAQRVADPALASAVEQTIADLQQEWLGASRPARWIARSRGYLAFWSVMLMAPWAFRQWPGRRRHRLFRRMEWRFDMTSVARIRFVVVLAVIGLAAGYAVALTRPVMYRSSALLQVVPTRIAPGLAEGMVPATGGLEERMSAVIQVALSRTRLEGVIREFKLYESERQSMASEEVLDLMRRHIVIRAGSPAQFTVGFAGRDPMTVLKVTERLTAIVIDEAMVERLRIAEATQRFLESRIDAARMHLTEMAKAVAKEPPSTARQMELDVLQTTYKSLLTRRVEVDAMLELEQRQMGEQFAVLDAAQFPRKPIGPTRLQMTLGGGAAGLVAGLFMMAAALATRLLRERWGLAAATNA